MQNDNELQREADEAVRVLKEGGIILYHQKVFLFYMK